MRKIITVVAVASFALCGAGLIVAMATAGPDAPTRDLHSLTAATTPAPAPATVATANVPAPDADPYAVYLAHAPKGAVKLSREDAQIRAYLGCGQKFAPGTIDAALAAAYRPTGICDKG